MENEAPLRAMLAALRSTAAKAAPSAPADPSLTVWLQTALTCMDGTDDVLECGDGKLRFTAQPPIRALQEVLGVGATPLARRLKTKSDMETLAAFVTTSATICDALEACRGDGQATAAHAAAIAATWAGGLQGGNGVDVGSWANGICTHGHFYLANATNNPAALLVAAMLLDWALTGVRFAMLQGLSGAEGLFDDMLQRALPTHLNGRVRTLEGLVAGMSKPTFDNDGVQGVWARALLFHVSHTFHSIYTMLHMIEGDGTSRDFLVYSSIVPHALKSLKALQFTSLLTVAATGALRAAMLDSGLDAVTRIGLSPAAMQVIAKLNWQGPLLTSGLGISMLKMLNPEGGNTADDFYYRPYAAELDGAGSLLFWTCMAAKAERLKPNEKLEQFSRLVQFKDASRWCPAHDMLLMATGVVHRIVEWCLYRFQECGAKLPFEFAPATFIAVQKAILEVVEFADRFEAVSKVPAFTPITLLLSTIAATSQRNGNSMQRFLLKREQVGLMSPPHTPDVLSQILKFCAYRPEEEPELGRRKNAIKAKCDVIAPPTYILVLLTTCPHGEQDVANELARTAVGPLCDLLRAELDGVRAADGTFKTPTESQDRIIRASAGCLVVICFASLEIRDWAHTAVSEDRAVRVVEALHDRGLLRSLAGLLDSGYKSQMNEPLAVAGITLPLPPHVAILILLSLGSRSRVADNEVIDWAAVSLGTLGVSHLRECSRCATGHLESSADARRAVVLRAVQISYNWLEIALAVLRKRGTESPRAAAQMVATCLGLAARAATGFLADQGQTLPEVSAFSLLHTVGLCYCCWAPFQCHRLLAMMFDMVEIGGKPWIMPALRPHLLALGPVWSDVDKFLDQAKLRRYSMDLGSERLRICGGTFWKEAPQIMAPYTRAFLEANGAGNEERKRQMAEAAKVAEAAAAALLKEEESKAAAAAEAEEKKRLKRQRQKEKQRAAKEAAEAAAEAERLEKEEKKKAAAEERRRLKEAEEAVQREKEEKKLAAAEEKRRVKEAEEAAKREKEEAQRAAAGEKKKQAREAAAAEAQRKAAEEAAAAAAEAEAAAKRRAEQEAAEKAAADAAAKAAAQASWPLPPPSVDDDLGSLLSLLLPGVAVHENENAAAAMPAPGPAATALVPAAHPPHTPLAAAIATPERWQRLEAALRCPMSHKALYDPVLLTDGTTYDRVAATSSGFGSAAGARPNHAMRQLVQFVTGRNE